MNALNKLSIRARLGAGTAVSLLLLVAIGLLGYWAVEDTRATLQDQLDGKVRAIVETGELRTTLGKLQRFEKEVIIAANNANEAAEWRQSWQKSLVALRKGLGETRERADPGEAVIQEVEQVLAQLRSYEEGIAPVLEKIEQAQIDAAAAGAYAGQVQEFTQAADKALAAMAEQARQDLAGTQAALAARAQLMLTVIAGSVVVALLVLLPLTVFSLRALARSLAQARRLAERIAEGALDNEIVISQHDEVGQLVEGMGRMQAALRSMVEQVHMASRRISSASTEIAAGNQDLSTRTEQASSSLQQTAASMEELTGTVQQSASAAAQANQLAVSASDVAARGGRIVAQVVSTMDEINAASRKISDIVGVVDSIAFQTNILALNAAVEAARAGEQGRGFAVVASEVRSLAQRSAQAAREIQSLIGASVDKVESGAGLVKDAGSTMNEIVTSVRHVADTIAGITAAASAQSSGIGQVNASVSQLDRVTQQNAALVEQSAAAAASLEQQAQQLAGVVSAFKLAATSP
ncbi:MAG: chemotaxis protein [Rubrivivax sp. SCN 71-131]|jgi:methyl-accepting chemotaxis protein|nr:MAG: chemotaxis protein [Rubrivivax sp. SCN 71-131]